MSFCYSLIPDNFVMEVIAKSGKNRRTESDYIGFVYDRKHQKRYLLPRSNRINSHRENEKFNWLILNKKRRKVRRFYEREIYSPTFAQVSRSPTVRLNTRLEAFA